MKNCIEYDYSKLRGRIVEKFGNVKLFAKALGMSGTSVHKYLHNRTKFNQRSIERWCELLEIPLTEAVQYFFTQKV